MIGKLIMEIKSVLLKYEKSKKVVVGLLKIDKCRNIEIDKCCWCEPAYPPEEEDMPIRGLGGRVN